MRSHSVRTRIALWSTGLSAAVLCVFCGSVWLLIGRFGLRGVDHELLQRLVPQVGPGGAPERWPAFERAMRFVYGDVDETPPLLLVRDAQGHILHCSPWWPPRISTDLPRTDPHRRPPPRRRPPPPPPDGPPPEQAPPPLFFGLPPLPDRGGVDLLPPSFLTVGAGPHVWRLATLSSRDLSVTLGVSLGPLHGQLRFARYGLWLLVPLALLLLAWGSWVMSGRALAPLERLADAAEHVTAARLDERVPTDGMDLELDRLATVLNAMLDRLQGSFEQATRFSADAAHELKTPLAVLQGQVELALHAAEPDSEAQRTLAGLLDEVQRLKAIVRKLLLLSLADAGRLELATEPVDLSALVGRVVEDTELLSDGIAVRGQVAPGLIVAADGDLLEQAVSNLATNALKYNRAGGCVELVLAARDGAAVLQVRNTGATIPPEDHERIFERFYRADRARSGRDGVGLGLSLAREIIRAHGGELRLLGSEADRTVFEVRLPFSSGSDPAPGSPAR